MTRSRYERLANIHAKAAGALIERNDDTLKRGVVARVDAVALVHAQLATAYATLARKENA